MSKKKTLGATAAAEMLNVSDRLVRKMCQEGTLRAEKDGHNWVIEQTSVKETIRERAKALRQKQKKGGKR